MKKMIMLLFLAILISVATIGCKSKKQQGEDAPLTDFQLTYGIGPITQPMNLKPIDRPYAKTGEKPFAEKCGSCHELDTKKVGPPLRDIMFRRKPEFVMNMMLNPDQMMRRHPEIQKLFALYQSPMAVPGLKQDEARAILEFLRREALAAPGTGKKYTKKDTKKKDEQNVIEGD
jgi:cytochrome c